MIKYIDSVLLTVFASIIVLAAFGIPAALFASADESGLSIDIWWPTDGAHVSGVQPFKAMINGTDVSHYQMYWQVDNGQLVEMSDNDTDSPHKEASVDLSQWNWKGSGPYTVNFVANENGSVVGQRSVEIYVGGNSAAAPAASAANASAGTPAGTANAPAASPAVATASSAPATAAVAPPINAASIDVWWPTAGSAISGVQPFKAVVENRAADTYEMYWQVDNGQLVPMPENDTDSPHKEASVDVSHWSWQPTGNYTLTFVAKDTAGNTIATKSENIIVHNSSNATASAAKNSAPAPQMFSAFALSSAPAPRPMTAPQAPGMVNGMNLYVDPNSEAAAQANAWRQSNPSAATAMQVLASQPTAVWFGDWNSNVESDVHSVVSAASAEGATPVLVAYDIPERDCGSYSSGGASAPSAYQSWIQSFAEGIGSAPAIVILEPDALAEISCLSSQDQATRLSLLSHAVSTFKSNPNTKVYIDAGHSNWIDAHTMASLLQQAGIGEADGFSLNVSNFDATQNEIAYGTELSGLVGNKHFVVDTSRNGLGSDGLWCNPPGRAIGQKPTIDTGNPLLDAYLWIKTPGESDGSCNGGPSAGQWWPSYALELVKNAQ
ncbi:MAG: glycoside hydrolase family 6 protein [Minisyncoccia bacterium]